MKWKNDRAIYIQVVEQFKHDVIIGKYRPKDKILSVREYALSLNVNPNTIVKVYDILVEEGLIVAKSTNGYYLTEDEIKINSLKESVAKEYCIEFLSKMGKIGYLKLDAIEKLKESD